MGCLQFIQERLSRPLSRAQTRRWSNVFKAETWRARWEHGKHVVLRCSRCSESNSALPFKAQWDLRIAAALWGVHQGCTPFCGHCRIVFCTALQADALGHCWIRTYGALGRREKCLNFKRFSRKKIPFCIQGGIWWCWPHSNPRAATGYNGFPIPALIAFHSLFAVGRGHLPQEEGTRAFVLLYFISLSDCLFLGNITTHPVIKASGSHRRRRGLGP